jgi:archaellum component FlaC
MDNSELTTKPTLGTILERINAQGEVMRAGFGSIEKRFQSMEKRIESIDYRLEQVEIRLDRVQGMVLEVRADVRELTRHSSNPH